MSLFGRPDDGVSVWGMKLMVGFDATLAVVRRYTHLAMACGLVMRSLEQYNSAGVLSPLTHVYEMLEISCRWLIACHFTSRVLEGELYLLH